jgi:sarcosine oxidase
MYDVIVIGLGAMGGATAQHLARRGQRVLGIEQYSRGHARGSSHGESRIIREIYFEHPLYVPIVQRAYELWRDLERETGERLLTITGGLMIGREDGPLVSGTLRSAAAHDIPHERFAPKEVAARFPGFSLQDDDIAVVDARAGILDADACVRAQHRVAETHGAELHFDERVMTWESDGDTMLVETTRGHYSARKLLLAAGPWMRDLVRCDDGAEGDRGIVLPLVVERQVLVWLEPSAHREWYSPMRCPIYLWDYSGGHLGYGFPDLGNGVKVGVFHDGDVVRDPHAEPRAVEAHEIERVRDALTRILPDVASGRLRDARTCPFTNTPDTHFIIDFHPSYPNVLVSSPCSGHGFKFASAIGELQADLLTKGTTIFDLSLFRLSRFQPAPGV